MITNISDELFDHVHIYLKTINYIAPALKLPSQQRIFATQLIALARSKGIFALEINNNNGEFKQIKEQKLCIVEILKDERSLFFTSRLKVNSVSKFRDAYKNLEDSTKIKLGGYCVPDFSHWNSVLKVPYLAYAHIKAENRRGTLSNSDQQEADIWLEIKSHEAFEYLSQMHKLNIV